MEQFNQYFKEMLEKIDVKLNDKQIEDFYCYMNELVEWNKNINLTAITEQNEVIQKHFIDSLTILKYLEDNNKIIDVGTGAGFPGRTSRVEDSAINPQYREKYDVATSRAVAQLNVLLEYLLPLVRVGGKCICMKGGNIEEELQNSKKALEILGGKVEKIESFELPNSDIKRNIIIIKKVKNTPKAYPRKAGTPSKKPLI